jgi:hypothetical protein
MGRNKATLRNRVADAAVDQLVGMLVHDFLNSAPPANARPMAA